MHINNKSSSVWISITTLKVVIVVVNGGYSSTMMELHLLFLIGVWVLLLVTLIDQIFKLRK